MTDEEIAQRLQDLDRREATLHADRLRFELRGALAAASCRPDAIDDALALLTTSAAPEFDSDGRITKLTIGANAYESSEKAAGAFMAARSHWLAPEEPRPVPRLVPLVAPVSKPKTQESGDKVEKPVYSPMDLVSQGWLKPPA